MASYNGKNSLFYILLDYTFAILLPMLLDQRDSIYYFETIGISNHLCYITNGISALCEISHNIRDGFDNI